MGGRSGGGGGFRSSNSIRDFSKIPGIASIPDAKVRKELIEALNDYEKVFGVRQDNIRLGKLKGDLGKTTSVAGKSVLITLDSGTFTLSASRIENKVKAYQKSGWFSKTSNPIRYPLVHELGHATWSIYHNSPKANSARKDVISAYRKFMSSSNTQGWGKYAKTHYGEWFAEGVAKHLYGKKDIHTQRIADIIKKHKL